MKKTSIVLGSVTIITVALIIACKPETKPAEQVQTFKKEVPDTINHVKRGEYLVSVIGCDDCHSPKKMGPNGPEIIAELRLSGYPSKRPLMAVDKNVIKEGWMMFSPDLTTAAGDWGESFAANLTSDATGIGNWTEEQFMKAIRHGKLKGLDGSRSLLPPMPWFIYKNMTDGDLKDIFAFLKTTNPVENVVPAPIAPEDLLTIKK